MRVIQLPLPFDDTTVEISLTKNQTAVVSAADADLASHNWWALESTRNGFYAARTLPKQKPRTQYMHRVILGRILGRELETHEEVDHIDLNKLNNVRTNLRLATTAQNQQNCTKRRHNTTGYKGVCRIKNGSGWVASISAGGTLYHLGTFDSPELAHEAYKAAAEKYHGAFARAA